MFVAVMVIVCGRHCRTPDLLLGCRGIARNITGIKLIVFPAAGKSVASSLAALMEPEVQPQPQNDFGECICNFMRFCACFSVLWKLAFGTTKQNIRKYNCG